MNELKLSKNKTNKNHAKRRNDYVRRLIFGPASILSEQKLKSSVNSDVNEHVVLFHKSYEQIEPLLFRTASYIAVKQLLIWTKKPIPRRLRSHAHNYYSVTIIFSVVREKMSPNERTTLVALKIMFTVKITSSQNPNFVISLTRNPAMPWQQPCYWTAVVS